ncbi:hypothetical protein DH2020_029304 [Rehmannia glutinosa]|uniref:Uncharacterized protein n=1 Tax=Rehmannia glutinosa TaxID=99300 RepID=A0ABR0VNX5_REHGL
MTRLDYKCHLSYPKCSSGCESGWTLYLEQSSTSPHASYNNQQHDFLDATKNHQSKILNQEDEDEDLSMVSDASSGPPHLHEQEGCDANIDTNGCFYHYPIIDEPFSRINNMKKNRDKNRRRKVQEQSSLLDDTASSPFFDVSDKSFSQPSVENVLEYSQGYSSTQFEVRPPYQEQYDFFRSSHSGNQLQQNQLKDGLKEKGGDAKK